MSRLTESYVRDAALKWLKCHYREAQHTEAVLARTEVCVKGGRARADGLVVSVPGDASVFTASLEAKSSKTILNVFATQAGKTGVWLWHAAIAGTLGLILAGHYGQRSGSWFLVWVFPVLVFVLVALAFLVLTYKCPYYRTVDVIDQVKLYPANERWIAVSTDAYNRSVARDDALRRRCQKEGIGLLRVSTREAVTPLCSPRPVTPSRGQPDFLARYAREKRIRKDLKDKAESSGSQPEVSLD